MDSQATVSEQLGSLAHLMALARMQNGLEATPLRNATKGRGRILAFLNIKDSVSTKNLATVLALRVSSLNELLAKLEADGYIERRPDPEDGRVSLIYLTDKGREADPTASAATVEPEDFLAPDECEEFRRLLAKVIGGFESTLDSGTLARFKAERERRREVLRSLFTGENDPEAPRSSAGFSPDAWASRFGSLPFWHAENHKAPSPADDPRVR